MGGRILRVVETPGHTPGSISLLDQENRILFSGDTVSYGPVFLFGDHRDVHIYRRTLDKLQTMGGFDTIYPCHNTCPVSLTVLPSLIAAVDGALDGAWSPYRRKCPCRMACVPIPTRWASAASCTANKGGYFYGYSF